MITKSNWGGAQRYVFDLAVHARAAGFSVAVASGGDGKLVERLSDASVRTITLPSLRNDIGLLGSVYTLVTLIRLFRKEKPDLIHTNSTVAGLLGALAGRIARVPSIVFTSHGWAFNEDRPLLILSFLFILQWLTLLLSHHAIAVSKKTKAQVKHLPFVEKKISVIYNGISPIKSLSREKARLSRKWSLQ